MTTSNENTLTEKLGATVAATGLAVSAFATPALATETDEVAEPAQDKTAVQRKPGTDAQDDQKRAQVAEQTALNAVDNVFLKAPAAYENGSDGWISELTLVSGGTINIDEALENRLEETPDGLHVYGKPVPLSDAAAAGIPPETKTWEIPVGNQDGIQGYVYAHTEPGENNIAVKVTSIHYSQTQV